MQRAKQTEVSGIPASTTSLLVTVRRRLIEFGKVIERFEDLAEQKLEQRTQTYGRAQSLVALSEKLEAPRPTGYEQPRTVAWTKAEAAIEKAEPV